MCFCGLVEGTQQVTQHILHITHNGHLCVTNLANFCGVNVHVDDLGVGSKLASFSGHPVIKSSTEYHQEVRFLERQNSGDGPVHTGHTEIQGARVGESTSRHQSGDYWSAHLVGKRCELFVSSRTNDSTTHIQNRLRGFRNHLRSNLDLLRVRLRHRVVTGEINLWWPNKRCRLLLGVFGDVHQHGAGATRGRDVDSGSNHTRDFFGLGHQERVLGDRHGHTGDIHLLESISSHRGGEDLTGDGKQRD